MKSILVIFLAITFYGCQQQPSSDLLVDSSICLVDSIYLPDADQHYGSLAFIENNKLLICCYLNRKKDRLYLVEGKTLVDSIFIPKEFKNEKFQFTLDSAGYTYFLFSNCIYKCKDTVIENKYYYNNKHIDLSTTYFPFEIVNGTFLLGKIPNCKMYEKEGRDKYFSSDHLGLYTLKNDSIVEVHSFYKFPDSYKKNFYNEYYPVIFRTKDTGIIYVFSLYPDIGYYKIIPGEHIKHNIDNLTKNYLPPMDIDSISLLYYSKKHSLYSEKFVKINQDNVSKELALFQMLKIDGQQSGPFMQIYQDKPFLVNIIDTNYIVRKKIYFKNNLNKILPRSTFFDNKIFIPTFNENSITLYVYKTI